MDLSLKTKQLQTLKISPKILQGLQVMQYNSGELAEYLKSELAENPFLEESENNNTVPLNSEELNWQDQNKYQRETLESNFYNNFHKPSTSDIIEKTTASRTSLYEYLSEQLSFAYLKETKESLEYKIGEYIISSIDERGFFPAAEIEAGINYFQKKSITAKEQTSKNQSPESAAITKNIKEIFLNVLETIQDFDPLGIASLDVQNFLIYQIKNSESLHFLALEILINDYELFQKKKIQMLMQKYEVSKKEMNETIDYIGQFEIFPLRNYTQQENDIVYIQPDVLVETIADKINVYLHNKGIPQLQINQNLVDSLHKEIAINKISPEQKKHFNQKLQAAKLLIANLHYRATNLEKVMERLVVVQRDFFFQGFAAIKPYTLSKLAAEITVNIGTISRLVRAKYIETPWGIFPLRKLFDHAIGDHKTPATKVKNLIAQIITDYDGDKKLSDHKIMNILNKQGYKVARRTVNKYRQQLQILSSMER